ncbi:MAG TPA: TonB-dependent receptor [Blastocatellia bacterium]|nr:TonB-dependent receptor [Blastocatellia bacterium]
MKHLTSKVTAVAKATGLMLALLLAVGLMPSLASAQVLYGSIVGNVTDQNGAVVAGATIKITNKGTSQTREAVSNADGEFLILNVQPGDYDLKATKQGFTTYSQTGLVISANNAQRVDVSLKIGNVSETVSVQADVTTLQTESSSVKAEINSKEIQALPINNYRNYQSLLNLVPGTTPAGFQNSTTDTPERALTTNVNGTARNNNNTRIDGAQSVNIWLPHHSSYVAPSESVQEVNVSTNNFEAEQGLAGGAAVQVITKSGTNQFHGSAFAYHDNHFFRAKNAFYPTTVAGAPNPNKPKLLRTIPGATLGGPIIKDKLFFFGSWEGLYEGTLGDGFFTVPTADVRSGNFSAYNVSIYDPLTGNINGTGRTLFNGAIIPANRIHPAAAKMLALIPQPNLKDASGNIAQVNNLYRSAPQVFNRNNYDIKVNWNRNEKHQVWTKFSHMNADVSSEFALGAAGGPALPSGGGTGTGNTKSYIGTVGHTWTLGSGFIVDGNFSVSHRSHVTLPSDYGTNFGLDVLGIPGTNGSDPRQSGIPAFNISGYTSLGNLNTWTPVERNERSYTFTQNATKLFGSHDVRFGVDIVKHELNHWQPEIGAGPRGAFNFSGNTTVLNGGAGANQYNAFAAFLLGMPQSVQKSLQYEVMTTREWQTGFYLRDRWQFNRNLTLTLGLRYELFPMMHRADRGIELLDLNSPVVLNSAGQPNGVMRVLIGGKGSNPSDLGVGSSKKLFAPRVGFAYRLGDDTVIRGGYGITYDPMPFGRPLRGFYPATVAQTFVATGPGANETFTPWGFNDATSRIAGLTLGIPNFGGPDLSTGVVSLPGTVDMRSPYPGTLKRGYIQSWNLMVERKLIKDIKVEVGYVGTGTRNQFGDIEVNAAQTPNSTRYLQQKYGRTASTLLWNGFMSTSYHALQVAVNRRYSNGLFIKGAYTWSKAINFFDDSGWAGLPLFNAQSQISRNRGLAGFDIPHNFQLGASYELPFGKGKKWMTDNVAGKVLGGWSLSGIGSLVSGRPLTVTAAAGSLNAPGNSQTPDLIGSISYPKNTGGGSAIWFDPSAFRPVDFSPEWLASVAAGTTRPFRFGTSGRSVLRGPGFPNLDVSLIRQFRMFEKITTDFRVDVFNFTNTPQFNNPGTNASAPSRDAQGNILKDAAGNLRLNGFGQVLSARDTQRQFRFGLRIGF